MNLSSIDKDRRRRRVRRARDHLSKPWIQFTPRDGDPDGDTRGPFSPTHEQTSTDDPATPSPSRWPKRSEGSKGNKVTKKKRKSNRKRKSKRKRKRR